MVTTATLLELNPVQEGGGYIFLVPPERVEKTGGLVTWLFGPVEAELRPRHHCLEVTMLFDRGIYKCLLNYFSKIETSPLFISVSLKYLLYFI